MTELSTEVKPLSSEAIDTAEQHLRDMYRNFKAYILAINPASSQPNPMTRAFLAPANTLSVK